MKTGFILKKQKTILDFFKTNVKFHFYCPVVIKLIIIFDLALNIYTACFTKSLSV